MHNLIPLNGDKIFDTTFGFNSITVENDISVGNLVNGIRLPEEYYNTVLVSNYKFKDQWSSKNLLIYLMKRINMKKKLGSVNFRKVCYRSHRV